MTNYSNLTIFFLTAGLGTRLKPITNQLPKPLVNFAKIPLLIHAWDFVSKDITFKNVIFNGYHLKDLLFNWIMKNKNIFNPAHVILSDESNQILETGGALHQQKKILKSDPYFLVMNGDEVLFNQTIDHPIPKMIGYHLKHQALATLLVTNHPDVGTKLGGVWCDNHYQVKYFSKNIIPDLKGWHYVGCMILSSRIFDFFSDVLGPCHIFNDVLIKAIEKKERVLVFPWDIFWIEAGVYENFYENEKKLIQLSQKNPLIYQQLESRRIYLRTN